MFILEQKYGNDGYAFWFKILELLGDSEGHFVDCRKEDTWEFLQAKTHLDGDTCSEILMFLSKLEAIDSKLWEKKVIWSQHFVDGIAPVYMNRRIETPKRPNFYRQKSHRAKVSTDQKSQRKEVEEGSRGRKRGGDSKESPPPIQGEPEGGHTLDTSLIVHPSGSPCYLLAKRIVENAASLDAPKVGLNKDSLAQREKRIQDSAEDIHKLIEISFDRYPPKKAIQLANDILTWAFEQPKTRTGFSWKANLQTGRTFRYHLDSQLKGNKRKPGGELLRQYLASPEHQAKIETKRIEKRTAQRQAEWEKEEKETRDEEERLRKIREEQGDIAWAQALLKGFGFESVEGIPADSFLLESPRIQEAVKILKEKKDG